MVKNGAANMGEAKKDKKPDEPMYKKVKTLLFERFVLKGLTPFFSLLGLVVLFVLSDRWFETSSCLTKFEMCGFVNSSLCHLLNRRVRNKWK